MYQKFIINEDRLISGVVDEHRQLADDHSTTEGGGWWHMDLESRKMWLYGRSILFGNVPKKRLQEVIASGRHNYPGFTWYFSRSSRLEHAMQKSELLG